MPIRVYKCDACEHTFESLEAWDEKCKLKCPNCKKKKLYRVPQLFHFSVVQSDSEVTTIAQMAERNTKKLSKEQISKKESKRTLKKPKRYDPWWRKGKPIDKKLADLTPKQKKDYIEKGKYE